MPRHRVNCWHASVMSMMIAAETLHATGPKFCMRGGRKRDALSFFRKEDSARCSWEKTRSEWYVLSQQSLVHRTKDLVRCMQYQQSWKDTKEYLNRRGTRIRVFRVRLRAPFLPPFSLILPPSLKNQAVSNLLTFFPSFTFPLSPFFWLLENSDLGTPMI